MKFYPLASECEDINSLQEEYKSGHEIGIVTVGEEYLFFKRRLKCYYIPYSELTRCYRRVMLVPARMCCGKGDLPVENLVICSGEKELAEIQLPGTKAAKILLEELKIKSPDTEFTKPAKKDEPEE